MQNFNYTLTASLAAVPGSPAAAQHAELHETLAIGDSDRGYQRRLSLQHDASGGLSVVARLQRKLARVQAVQLAADEQEAGLLQIGIVGLLAHDGLLPDLAELHVHERQVQVVVAEVLDDAAAQTAARAPGHFHIRVPLRISGFASGIYCVNVNGLERRFLMTE